MTLTLLCQSCTFDENKTIIMTYSTGYLFRSSIRFIGYALLFCGVLYILNNTAMGIILTLIGGFISFAKTGSEFNTKKQVMREFIMAFGVKFGSWVSYDAYPELAVLMRKETLGHRTIGNNLYDSDVHYDVYLLNESHRKKILLYRGSSWDKSVAQGEKMGEELGLKFTTYNPTISAATMARRRR